MNCWATAAKRAKQKLTFSWLWAITCSLKCVLITHYIYSTYNNTIIDFNLPCSAFISTNTELILSNTLQKAVIRIFQVYIYRCRYNFSYEVFISALMNNNDAREPILTFTGGLKLFVNVLKNHKDMLSLKNSFLTFKKKKKKKITQGPLTGILLQLSVMAFSSSLAQTWEQFAWERFLMCCTSCCYWNVSHRMLKPWLGPSSKRHVPQNPGAYMSHGAMFY